MGGGGKRIAAGLATFLVCATVFALVFNEDGKSEGTRPDELVSPLQVGLYSVRAEREARQYDEKAERQISFATENDNSATSERELSEKEEKRARESAYLAADIKAQVDKLLESGRDQVNQATKIKAKASNLQAEGNELLKISKKAKEEAESLKDKYYAGMDKYSKAVSKIDDASAKAQSVLDQLNAQSLVLAQIATQYNSVTKDGKDPNTPAALALKAQLQKAQVDLAAVEAGKDKAFEASAAASKLADENQPIVIQAEKDKRASDMAFQKFARATGEADQLQNRADALLKRADDIDTLVDDTQEDLEKKRKEFEHYKNRAQTEMAISLQAEDKEAVLRKKAEAERASAAKDSDKARALRALAIKGVNNVMEQARAPADVAPPS
mmetsp:Transcript_12481/g.34311  ORF Transcript_12481/g.34311 Transcript_12481/m.34311 type:complete len:384 (-) Transcript_12481:201-1352(-)